MPRWNDGLVNAFPVPDDALSKLSLSEKEGDASAIRFNQEADVPSDIAYNQDPFPLFSLPAELRNRIYHLVLFSKPSYRLATGKRRGSRLDILLACKRLHQESSYVLYTTHKFLVFPIQEFTALPTIQELPLHYRVLVSNLAMRVGSSWTNPPKSWRVTKSLRRCLINLQNVQTLSVFVEFDPSHPAFRKFRISETFYTDFVGDLIEDVLGAMPQLKYVQLDGNPGVDVQGPLVSRLREESLEQEKQVRWGREAGWAHKANIPPLLLQPTSASDPRTVVPLRDEKARSTAAATNIPMLHNRLLEQVKNS